VPSAACATTDDLSGVVSVASVAVSGGKPNGVGTFTVTCSGGTDKAGNLAEPASITYEVIYDWDGFLQPIDDTHHQVGVTRSIFKGGSTVPAKFQLKDAAGNVVQANSVPQWLEPTNVGPLTGVIDETVGTDPLSSGSAFAWDATAQQYVYNWGTDKAQSNSNWRIGVTLDDGQTYYQTIGLR
jgi:hypothetical protein